MRLEEVTAELRPRSAWESVDLGFAMVRRHFKRIAAAWCLTVLPLWALILLLSPVISLGFALLIIWWLKPLYDRVPLFILSRALFGAPPTLGAVLRAWPGMLFKNSLSLLVMRVPWWLAGPQFAWARCLLLPAVDLEGQKGQGLRTRGAVILRQASGKAHALLCLCVLYEFLLAFGIFVAGVSFISGLPDQSERVFRQIEMLEQGAPPAWLIWSCTGLYLFSMSIVEIFYVGGGFGLYLNCRTHLEGWDVEIVFRRLAQRIAKLTTVLLVACGLAYGLTSSAYGAPEIERNTTGIQPKPSKERETITRVKGDNDFKVHTEKYRVPKERKKRERSDGGDLATPPLAPLGTLLFYLAVTAAIVGLCWLIYTNRHLFNRGPAVGTDEPAAPRTVMGMDVTPESLPTDIVRAARDRWADGDARGALSLLYRGSLVWLVHVARLRIRESDTEGDCLRHTADLTEPARRDYFSTLTDQWVGAAYAHRVPGDQDMERLFEQWPFAGGGRFA